MTRIAVLAVLLLAACGGQQAPPRDVPDERTEDTTERGATADATSDEMPPPPDACPPSFDAPGPSCEGANADLRCTYPEGQCWCGRPRLCQGIAPRPAPPEWVCRRPDPVCPAPGTPCEGNASCSPWCCGRGVVCVNGTYEPRDFPCPP